MSRVKNFIFNHEEMIQIIIWMFFAVSCLYETEYSSVINLVFDYLILKTIDVLIKKAIEMVFI